MKKIKLEDGSEVITYNPRPGFDPTKATASELLANGFPALKEYPEHRERFLRVWRQLGGKYHYVQPTFRVNRDKIHGPRIRNAKDGTETSTNWSGGVVHAPAGQSFKWIEGDWTVPNVDAPTAGQWYYSSSWIGIDGDGSGDVFQAGVECEVYRNGTSLTTNIYPWWEWYPNSEVQITNLSVRPGDMVTMLLCFHQGAGSIAGSVSFTNRTTGASTSVSLTAPTGTKLVGNCAEWIVEAPTVGGSQSAMADYGEVFFSVCEAVTNTGTTINGGSGNNMNMTAGSQVISEGTLLTPSVIQCSYLGANP